MECALLILYVNQLQKGTNAYLVCDLGFYIFIQNVNTGGPKQWAQLNGKAVEQDGESSDTSVIVGWMCLKSNDMLIVCLLIVIAPHVFAS